MLKEALIKSKRSLQHLKRVATRQVSQLMAVVLNKKLNNVDMRFKSCPTGLSGSSALRVAYRDIGKGR